MVNIIINSINHTCKTNGMGGKVFFKVLLRKRSFDSWTPEEIADWFKTLKLSKDYTSTILSTHIDGSFVKLMVDENLWVECQIDVPSDQMKIKFGFKKFT